MMYFVNADCLELVVGLAHKIKRSRGYARDGHHCKAQVSITMGMLIEVATGV
jgi:hypothetical protein